MANPDLSTITIRPASPTDALALKRLAALDSARLPKGDLIVAESEGTLVAALSPEYGAVVADPFTPTAAIVELLRLAAAGGSGETRRARRRLPRLIPALRGV
jgi:hypothetical protein